MKILLILSLCMSVPAFGMDWQASAQYKAVEDLSKANEKAQAKLLALLEAQVEWNKQTSAKLGELQQALAEHENLARERGDAGAQNQAILFLLAPVLYYSALEALKNLSLFL